MASDASNTICFASGNREIWRPYFRAGNAPVSRCHSAKLCPLTGKQFQCHIGAGERTPSRDWSSIDRNANEQTRPPMTWEYCISLIRQRGPLLQPLQLPQRLYRTHRLAHSSTRYNTRCKVRELEVVILYRFQNLSGDIATLCDQHREHLVEELCHRGVGNQWNA